MEIFDNLFHLDHLLGSQDTVSDILQMPLPQAPKSAGELTGGIVVLCDPHTYPHSIRRAVNVPRFAAAVGLHPELARSAIGSSPYRHRCTISSHDRQGRRQHPSPHWGRCRPRCRC
ncbi:hypothetical protein PoB_000641900 [Plakobranchus ocellatus]|uniref:Uncharacterized protein n=1 Tax=Plakobranchus ocellatus TaxID=259542 RepID=A0AAV3YCX7_9GAST|nr:hypothetical protein PoB_000641900 [Plakobranchus ocellatus]